MENNDHESEDKYSDWCAARAFLMHFMYENCSLQQLNNILSIQSSRYLFGLALDQKSGKLVPKRSDNVLRFGRR